jgi:subtilisin family serine protease
MLAPLLVMLVLSALPAAGGRAAAPIAPRVEQDLAREGAADVLVVFAERPDLRAARELPTRRARGRFVFEALTAAARRSQGGLRARLEALGVPYRAHYLGNLIRLRADEALLREIALRPEVDRIVADPRVPMALPLPSGADAEAAEAVAGAEWGVARVNAPALWFLGFTGQGVVVGVQDTGVEWTHPALLAKYRGWDGQAASHDYNWHDAIQPTFAPLDDHDHGTHVTGTIVGDDGAGNQIGVAPGARWIACRNMNFGVGTPGTYTECFEFFLAPYPFDGDPALDGDPSLAPDVINNSWACPPSEGCDPETLRSIVEAVRAAGILVVAATGNSGSACGTVSDPPAIYDATFSAGATDSSDAIASFSSRGPVTVDGSNRAKPDLAAPGVFVRSSVRGGLYVAWNGTSMASPHVAGAAALLRSAIPALDGRPGLMEQLLLAGARPKTAPFACGGESAGAVPNLTFGAGIVDAYGSLATDGDLDGVPASTDNCPATANTDQADADGDDAGDACDCAPADPALSAPPGEVPFLAFLNPTTLAWNWAPGASLHDVFSATRAVAADPPSAFTCHAADAAGFTLTISEEPGEGALLFLITGKNACGSGTPGFATSGERPPPSPCP